MAFSCFFSSCSPHCGDFLPKPGSRRAVAGSRRQSEGSWRAVGGQSEGSRVRRGRQPQGAADRCLKQPHRPWEAERFNGIHLFFYIEIAKRFSVSAP